MLDSRFTSLWWAMADVPRLVLRIRNMQPILIWGHLHINTKILPVSKSRFYRLANNVNIDVSV